MKYLKIIISIIYYCLIFFSCLAGVYFADNEGFVRETIFLVYVAMTTYGIIELIFRHISFLKNRIIILRIIFLVFCLVSSYALFVTTDEMILKKELNASLESLGIVDINLQPRTSGYLANIKFKISKEEFLTLVGTLGFKETSSSGVSLFNPETRNIEYGPIENENGVLYFEKDESEDEYSPIDTKYLLYKTNTSVAYYEHMNYKSSD